MFTATNKECVRPAREQSEDNCLPNSNALDCLLLISPLILLYVVFIHCKYAHFVLPDGYYPTFLQTDSLLSHRRKFGCRLQ